MAPVERFLAFEAASGLLLLAAATVALAWANSPWRDSYTALWHLPFGVRLGPLSFERDLHFWVNDGLMSVFFFVVGLEIRREIYSGELSSLRRAALPLAAAFGGMLVPALLFGAVNLGQTTLTGWGIPMATDIAFALGVLGLLGSRVPPAVRVLLLSLAVVDDVGAILVIAVFYSSGLAPVGFVVAALALSSIVAMQAFGIRSLRAYLVPALISWAGTYAAGIHPTLAGVAVGLLTPAQTWFGREGLLIHADAAIAAIRAQPGAAPHTMLERLNTARREAVSPVERLLRSLHGWVTFGVMPLFALANAGVALGHASWSGAPLLVFTGVGVGLLLGKPLGILGFAWLATRLGLATLPTGVTWPQVGVVGAIAGIGFTMSLFIAALALPPGGELESAKVGVLVASGVAGLVGLGLGRAVFSSPVRP